MLHSLQYVNNLFNKVCRPCGDLDMITISSANNNRKIVKKSILSFRFESKNACTSLIKSKNHNNNKFYSITSLFFHLNTLCVNIHKDGKEQTEAQCLYESCPFIWIYNTYIAKGIGVYPVLHRYCFQKNLTMMKIYKHIIS